MGLFAGYYGNSCNDDIEFEVDGKTGTKPSNQLWDIFEKKKRKEVHIS